MIFDFDMGIYNKNSMNRKKNISPIEIFAAETHTNGNYMKVKGFKS